jgi:drug/metabolite transporter (DMT)-like permease
MFAALFVTVIGSMLIILGGVNDNKDRVWYQFLFTFNIDWRTLGLTSTDLLGIGMSIAAATCLAAYMVIVKSLKSSGSASAFLTDGENMFIFQTVFIALILLVPSLILEDWSVYLRLSWYNWGMFMLFIILVLLIANLVSILCIQSIGATTVGSILSLRLVSAIIFSAIILHENLSTLWQVIGSVIVLASVSVFLFWQQKRLSIPGTKTPTQEEQVELEAVIENQSTMEEENDNIRLTQQQEKETQENNVSSDK